MVPMTSMVVVCIESHDLHGTLHGRVSRLGGRVRIYTHVLSGQGPQRGPGPDPHPNGYLWGSYSVTLYIVTRPSGMYEVEPVLDQFLSKVNILWA